RVTELGIAHARHCGHEPVGALGMALAGVVVVDGNRRRARERTHVGQESRGPASMPPSARNSEPVQYDDLSDARNSATRAISIGCAFRRSGYDENIAACS